MPSPSRQERHRVRQEHELLEAQKRKAERMEAHKRRMRKQAEDAAYAKAERARRHQERVAEDTRRRRERDARHASPNSSQSSYSGSEYFYGAYYQSWSQPNPPPPVSPIYGAVDRYKTGLERMNQLAATPGVQLSFADIAWPTVYPIRGTHDISKDAVEHVALSESLYPGKDRRRRLVAFLLEWHPDKFVGRWMQHVCECDRAAVKEGVTIVAGIVNDLLSGSA
ncbi:unnamed protein product [Rhizoctonia solani]|uniref:Uncharacterized protein n=1 Tax=Rhizoctonia solani TaxID=456999 RepID=A0A8H2XQJ5_9AGAM|nr:unnamed protein product [Rhizoctonia solani]